MVPGMSKHGRQAVEARWCPLLEQAERERLTSIAAARSGPARRGATLPAIVVLSIVLALIAGFTVAPTALGAQDGDYTAEEEANLEVARRFFEELHDAGDLAVAEEIVAANAVFHIPGGELRGPEGIGGLVTLLRSAFPDAVFPMEDVAVDGDTVAVRWTMRGTSEGDFQGIAPTGEAVELPGTAFLTIEDGMIVEDWVTYDQLGLLQQLGAVPGEATPAA